MKNLAICISGHVRDYENYWDNLNENIILFNSDNYNIDIFISTWRELTTHKGESFLRGKQNRFTALNPKAHKIHMSQDNLTKIYSPVSILVDIESEWLYEHALIHSGMGNNPVAVFSMFFKIYQCGRLFQDRVEQYQKKYDVVIRTRFELEVPKKINLNSFDVEDDIIYVEPDWVDPLPDHWMSDKFAIMSPKVYELYYNFYYRLEYYINETKNLHPERLIGKYMKDNQINICKTDKIGLIRVL